MKGRNTLSLNRATVAEAVELWLAAHFKTPPNVESVAWIARDGGILEVELTEKENVDD